MAQPYPDSLSFDKIILEVKGDLNGDTIPDSVVVSQDTLDNAAPYCLQIFLIEPTGKPQLIVSTTSAIVPQYPNGKSEYAEGNDFDTVTIKSRVISIRQLLTRGYYIHKYRYQHGNFELIGFTSASCDGSSTCTDIDFNLSTGVRIERQTLISEDKPFSSKKRIVKIRPLPLLQDVVPFSSEYY